MDALFLRLNVPGLLPGTAKGLFLREAAAFLADLNAIHPFREGNGRVQLAFLHLIAERARHPLRLEDVRPETFMPAMVRSFSGDIEPLLSELAAMAG
jgi:cell filamentation protein